MATRSIAIIGASKHREKFSNKCVRAYAKLGWMVFPVNPKEQEIEGFKCYSHVFEVPGKIDRVSIYLPPSVGLSIVPDLVKAKVKEVILNPGAESDELIFALNRANIKPITVCSIRLEGLSPEGI